MLPRSPAPLIGPVHMRQNPTLVASGSRCPTELSDGGSSDPLIRLTAELSRMVERSVTLVAILFPVVALSLLFDATSAYFDSHAIAAMLVMLASLMLLVALSALGSQGRKR